MTDRTYYLVKRGTTWDMRQTRFADKFKRGVDHPHDVCATGFTAEAMREMVERHGFDVDLSCLEDE